VVIASRSSSYACLLQSNNDHLAGSPWRVSLYLDDRASSEQHAALAAIVPGRADGSTRRHFAAAIGTVPCCLACPHRVVSRVPPLVHSRGHLSHCACRDTGRGARPGGLRHARFRPARPGGCRRLLPRLIRGLAWSGADVVGWAAERRGQLPAAVSTTGYLELFRADLFADGLACLRWRC
jgi:hypothetical protein